MKLFTSIASLLFVTSSAFAQTATINGESVNLVSDSPLVFDTMADCNTFKCMMDRSDISFITSDYRNIWVTNSVDAITTCDFARDKNVSDEIIVTLLPDDGSKRIVGGCK